jgi:phosphoglucomutase
MSNAKDVPAKVSPLAGHPATLAMLVDVPRLVTAYYTEVPDASVPAQRVTFGTSGHRGSAFKVTFNEGHVLAISQAICDYRRQQGIGGPLFLGIDTHALSVPAYASALEVLAANGVQVMLAVKDEYTPTPVISHAILTYNRGRARGDSGRADGIVITPSHNPPDNGGFKYNPPNGGPADQDVTGWIEARANAFLEGRMQDVQRITLDKAQRARRRTGMIFSMLTSMISPMCSTWRPSAARSCGWAWIRSAARVFTTGARLPSVIAWISRW